MLVATEEGKEVATCVWKALAEGYVVAMEGEG